MFSQRSLAALAVLIGSPIIIWIIVQRYRRRKVRRPVDYQRLLTKFSQERVKKSWIATIGKDGIVSGYLPDQGLAVTIGEDGKPSGYLRDR
jgi:hypothetical protein